MRRGTPEYDEYRQGVCRRADEQLATALRRFTLQELHKDWQCNLSPRTRDIFRTEYARRGFDPPKVP